MLIGLYYYIFGDEGFECREHDAGASWGGLAVCAESVYEGDDECVGEE